MRYFPFFFDLKDRHVVIAGGGEQALQKLRLLSRTDAAITVVAPTLHPEIVEHVMSGRVTWCAQDPETADIDDTHLLIVADVDEDKACRLSAAASGILVNVVDRPHLSNVITPALIDRDPLVIAIGTEGTSPVLAQGLKARIEAQLSPRLGRLARAASQLRERVSKALPEGRARREFWQNYFFGPIADAHATGQTSRFDTLVDEALAGSRITLGRVALVGAGPGDPELLTLKAQRLLQQADVIVHDRLIGPDILDYARRDAERIVVGKIPGGPSHKQDDINRILIDEARKGRLVVRLKGGDPYIFGRGAEEQAALEAHDIPVEVVPGITAALGCAASARLPLTARGSHRMLTIMTGATENGLPDYDWRELSRAGRTIAIYMGVRAAGHIGDRLLRAGIRPETSVTVIENGTLSDELIVETDVAGLAGGLRDYGIKGPAMIFIGAPKAASAGAETTDSSIVLFPVHARSPAEAWRQVIA